MVDKLLEIILGYGLEALFFTLFLVYGKKLKEKRVTLFILMFLEYLLLKCFIKYDVWFQISYTFMTFLILKLLYKEKANILDVFVFALSSIILIAISVPSYMIVLYTCKIYIVAVILNRVLLFGTFILYKDKLNKLYLKFASLWNRHNDPNKIRSLTLRNITIIIFNVMFYVINLLMIYFITNLRWKWGVSYGWLGQLAMVLFRRRWWIKFK